MEITTDMLLSMRIGCKKTYSCEDCDVKNICDIVDFEFRPEENPED